MPSEQARKEKKILILHAIQAGKDSRLEKCIRKRVSRKLDLTAIRAGKYGRPEQQAR